MNCLIPSTLIPGHSDSACVLDPTRLLVHPLLAAFIVRFLWNFYDRCDLLFPQRLLKFVKFGFKMADLAAILCLQRYFKKSKKSAVARTLLKFDIYIKHCIVYQNDKFRSEKNSRWRRYQPFCRGTPFSGQNTFFIIQTNSLYLWFSSPAIFQRNESLIFFGFLF